MTAPTALTHRANTELVAVAFFKTIHPNVGTTLPEKTDSWTDLGFVQVTNQGGNRNIYVPMRHPLVRVDAWAVKPGSSKPPWGKAGDLAETVIHLCESVNNVRLALPNNYPDAQLFTAFAPNDPQRVPDPSGYARFTFLVQINWAPVTTE